MNLMKRFKSNWARGAAVAVLLALVLTPLVFDLGDYILTVVTLFLIYIILSQSWNLMGGYAGQVNLGLAAYFGVGAFCYNLLYSVGTPFWIAMLLGGLAATALSCVIGPPTLRLREAYFGIGTLAVAEVLALIMNILYPQVRYAPPSYWAIFSLRKAYFISLIATVLTMVTAYGVVSSRLGLILQAIRDDEDAANSSGINPAKYKMRVFFISSFLAGIAGGVFGFYRGVLAPAQQFNASWTIGPLMAATIGGWGTLMGPVWGSLVYVILQEILGRYVREAHFIITGIIFILVIMFMPNGLAQAGVEVRRALKSAVPRSRTPVQGGR